MRVLYVGDVMADPGQKIVTRLLPDIKTEYDVDFCIVQAENSDPEGHGPGHEEIDILKKAGGDFFTGGNHSMRGKHSAQLYANDEAPVIRPANLVGAAGSGWKIVDTGFGKVLIASMLGQMVGNQKLEISNPLTAVDSILEQTKDEKLAARIINFHGDYSSEKRVFGYYLDGRFSAVIGDHWHVPTADALIMPKGTAHITDVGMCGTLHSSLGVTTQVIIDRWKTGTPSRNQIEQNGPYQFNAVLIDIDTETGLSKSIQHIQRIVD